MGSRIAALLANAGFDVRLYDLPVEGDLVGTARKGVESALRARPAAFFLPEIAEDIQLCSLQDLHGLAEAHWIIEAIVEDLEIKRELFSRVDAATRDSMTVRCISTNTSGLSVNVMAAGRSKAFRRRFLGVHFFNPPRYMKLVELIPASDTDREVLTDVRRLLQDDLGKGAVECRDTPNFIANRLGVFAIMDVLHRMDRQAVSIAEVDAVTGVLLGRPRSATLRLIDLIGLDVLAHVARTAYDNLETDYGRQTFALPGFVSAMLEAGHLGEKSKAGFYKKGDDGTLLTLDFLDMSYRQSPAADLGSLAQVARSRQLKERLSGLRAADGPLAEFARDHLLETVAYAATHAAEMAAGLGQIDCAMRWGFNWEAGPFEIADLWGVKNLTADLDTPENRLPTLLRDVANIPEQRFYLPAGTHPAREFSLALPGHIARLRPNDDAELVANCALIESSDQARLLQIEEGGLLVFSGRLNVIGPETLDFVRRAIADRSFGYLVLYGDGGNFSAGADLGFIMAKIEEGQWRELEGYVEDFQDACMAVRFCRYPVIAGARGLALGGGCEFCLASAARVVAAELRIGLVETMVGLIPGAGGCKEMVRRCSGGDIEAAFRILFAGRFSDNAHQGRSWGLLQLDDAISMQDERIVQQAVRRGDDLAQSGYRAPTGEEVSAPGNDAFARLEAQLDEDHRAGTISIHDREVGGRLARVLCGGDRRTGQGIGEQELLDLERELFLELCGMKATQERIRHMLDTGKPLRN